MRIVVLGDGETWMAIDGAKVYDVEEPFEIEELRFLVQDFEAGKATDKKVELVADVSKMIEVIQGIHAGLLCVGEDELLENEKEMLRDINELMGVNTQEDDDAED